jgi:hypothetical protein
VQALVRAPEPERERERVVATVPTYPRTRVPAPAQKTTRPALMRALAHAELRMRLLRAASPPQHADCGGSR